MPVVEKFFYFKAYASAPFFIPTSDSLKMG
jgi:hypothetical protein